MIPVSNFTYEVNGALVTFTDASVGIPNSWNWDFGFVGGISTQQNPTNILFPNTGVYMITLTTSNLEGSSDPYSSSILINISNPSLSLTISEMVQCDLPNQIAVDSICFKNSIQKWQLYLQTLLNPPIPNNQVFHEAYWPPIANVLISKLIAYDMILNASETAMTSYYTSIKNLSQQTSTSTVQIADYSLDLGDNVEQTPIIINSIQINGVVIEPSPSFDTWQMALDWLNNLGYGLFYLQGKNLSSLANANILGTFQVTLNSVGHSLSFAQANIRVVPINQIIESSTNSTGMVGALKFIETGPSKTEWYDASSFWSAMFKSTGATSGASGSGSVFMNIVNSICMWASRLGIHLPMCPKQSTADVPVFVVAPNRKMCNNCISSFHLPPSKR